MEIVLIKKIINGDMSAYKELYDTYSGYALRTAYAITKNKDDASDAVQETFLKIYKNINTFDLSKPFKAWFYRILINECNNILRKRAPVVSMHEYLENNNQFSTNDTYAYEENETIYKALDHLNDMNRTPIVLKYLNDFTEKEIASILDINIGTVKSRLFNGRNKLREIIERLEKRSV